MNFTTMYNTSVKYYEQYWYLATYELNRFQFKRLWNANNSVKGLFKFIIFIFKNRF